MSVFWERYSALSKAKDGSPNATAKVLKLSSGSITAWSNGAIPVSRTLSKLSEYFDVSVDYLLGKDKSAAHDGQPISQREALMIKVRKELTELPDSELERALGVLRALKKK